MCSPDGSLSDIGEVETKEGESQIKSSGTWDNCCVKEGGWAKSLEAEEEQPQGGYGWGFQTREGKDKHKVVGYGEW